MRSVELETIAAQAQNFRDQGLAQLNRLIIGERDAKIGFMATMILGQNIILVGNPGGGKTTLGQDAYRIVDGISAEEISEIPPLADLTPKQLVGGMNSATKTIDDGVNPPRTEKTSSYITPILHEGTKVIFANEINRMNPHALNATLDAFEFAKVSNTAGTVELKNLKAGIATMNPKESRHMTFPIAVAMASRFGLGAIMGQVENDTQKRDDKIDEFLGGFESANDLEPVVHIDDLAEFKAALSSVTVSDEVRPFARNIIKKTRDVLATSRYEIDEADSRMAKQTIKTAKALALMSGSPTVHESHFIKASEYVVVARMGALCITGVNEIKEVVEKINPTPNSLEV